LNFREGIILTIQRSKTDQDGVGRKVGIPFGRTIHCPIRALETWSSLRVSSQAHPKTFRRPCLRFETIGAAPKPFSGRKALN